MSTFGQRLSQLRTNKKMSQEDLSKILKISKSAVGMYERDQREPAFELINLICDYFDVSVDYLMGRTENQAPSSEFASQFAINDKQTEGDNKNIGRAFLGGADKYTEEELDLARAAARAAVEAYRKGQRNRDEGNS